MLRIVANSNSLEHLTTHTLSRCHNAKRKPLRVVWTFLKDQFLFVTAIKPLKLIPNPRVTFAQPSATLLHASIYGTSACSRCSLQAIFRVACFKRGLNWFLMKKQLESTGTHEEGHLCSINNSLCYQFFSCWRTGWTELTIRCTAFNRCQGFMYCTYLLFYVL